jgi:hypothetical protein
MTSKLMRGLAIAAIASTAFVGVASAEWIDTASSGNGGVSTTDASGGAVTIGTLDDGGNTGSTTAVGAAGFQTGEDIAAMVIASILGGE